MAPGSGRRPAVVVLGGDCRRGRWCCGSDGSCCSGCFRCSWCSCRRRCCCLCWRTNSPVASGDPKMGRSRPSHPRGVPGGVDAIPSFAVAGTVVLDLGSASNAPDTCARISGGRPPNQALLQVRSSTEFRRKNRLNRAGRKCWKEKRGAVAAGSFGVGVDAEDSVRQLGWEQPVLSPENMG